MRVSVIVLSVVLVILLSVALALSLKPETGWMQTKDARYYFLEDGKMAVGSFHIDGIDRYFSSDGNYLPLVNSWNKVPEGYSPNLVNIEGQKPVFLCIATTYFSSSVAANAPLLVAQYNTSL